jgi:ORF6N domain
MRELTETPTGPWIQKRILLIRGKKVILDADLASLYGVSTKAFNQAVKRNLERFPDDFMFQLTQTEKSEVVTNCDHLPGLKFSPNLPHAFTEYGAVMAASILNSPKAVKVSVFVVRAFIQLQQLVTLNPDIDAKVRTLENRLQHHDSAIRSLSIAIRELTEPTLPPKRRRIGI